MSERKAKLFINQMFDTTGMESFASLETTCVVVHWPGEVCPTREEFLDLIAGVDAIFLGSTSIIIDEEVLNAAGPKLKVIGSKSAGYDNIDIDACKQAGVKVSTTPDVLTDTVAEYTVALLLATARRMNEAAQAVVNGEWGPFRATWMTGKDVLGTTVGIVGLGRIGAAVGKRLRAFDIARLVYHSRNESPHAALLNAQFMDFQTLLRVSDFVIVCCAYTSETKGMFDAKAFKTMKTSGVFVNVSRGGVVNQDDLYDALIAGEIWAAGLDVTDPEPLPPHSPLLTLKNCTVMPHIGSATTRTRFNMYELTFRNILCALNGEPMPSRLC